MEGYPRIVYALYLPSTNKRYIGSSVHPKARYQAHMSALRRGGHPVPDLQRDFSLGDGVVVFEVLDEIMPPDGRDKEYEWMIKFRTTDPAHGYNYLDKTAIYKVEHLGCEPVRLKREEAQCLRTAIKTAVDQTADTELLDLVLKILVRA